jgi:hypothetical protein
MKRYIIPIIIAALLPAMAFAAKMQGTLTLGAPAIEAVCIYDTEAKTATLGNGYNACINQYETGALYIPGTVTYNEETYKVVVGQFAFRLCDKFTSITIGEGVEQIDNYAFVGCSSVVSIVLPASLQTIGAGAFCNLSSLKTFLCKGTTAPTWDWNDVFSVLGTKASMEEMAQKRILYVPKDKLASYNDTKFDGTSSGTLTGANEKVGWQEAFARIYELSDEPYEITSLDAFKTFRDKVNEGTALSYYGTTNFKLTTDLDLSEINWEPIGTKTHPFSGIFDGGGHVIKSLTIDRVETDYIGLFGYATEATIYNMYLENPKVWGRDYVGTVIGYASNNTHLTDLLVIRSRSDEASAVFANSGSSGGIVGRANDGTIERCMFRGTIYGTGWSGGIAGNIFNNVTVTDCSAAYYFTNISQNQPKVGGIVGGAGSVTINRCLARHEFNVVSSSKGWIVGGTNRNEASSISNCIYWGVTGSLAANGIIGVQENSSTCTYTNNVSKDSQDDMKEDKAKSTLGENWYYFTDNYVDLPIPITLKDMYIKYCVDEADESTGLVYRPAYADDSDYEVIGYTGTATSLTIPATYKDKPVSAILDGVFKDNTTLTTITLGSNLKSIGAHAFENCDALTSVDLPDAVTFVGRDAFRGCDNLTSFNIGTGFENHEGNFLAYCPSMTTLTASRGNNNGYSCVDNVLTHKIKREETYYGYIIACAPGKEGDYTIPDLECSYITLFPYSFATCEKLTSITAPNKHIVLNDALFDGDYNLRYVDMRNVDGFKDESSSGYTDTTVNVDRNDANSPFYGMSEYTMVYLPSGNSAASGEPNAVIGGTANQIMLNDKWDFNPKVSPITATNGVSYSRMLNPDMVEITEETGESITIDGKETTKLEGHYEYAAAGYTCYLPYALTLSNENAKVYKPAETNVEAGVTTITFEQVENNAIEAYKPYYIVVSGSSGVDLSTDAEVTVSTDTGGSWTVGDYALKGTTETIPNSSLYNATYPTYILQSDGKWHKVPQDQPKAYIGSFRAYFQATSANAARALNMVIDDGEATTIDAVIRTIDANGTEHYYDMNGRLLSGKPQKGMYIHNGKKYINK